MKRESRLFLQDILEAAQHIEQFVAGFEYLQFQNDDKTSSAVIRKLEIIGEATKQIPDTIKTKYPEIKWKEIMGMRDRLIHGYFGVDYSLVWDTTQTDIPKLITEISRVLREIDQEAQASKAN
ncbi:DUF86 domain-containing protein [candidate division KSB1 bacterium]|nr:DUF86 domain-containing protein [candidate division KSB1 bacterium]